MKTIAVVCVSLVLSAVAACLAIASKQSTCPDVYDMAMYIDGCQAHSSGYCDRLETISAKCLLDRAAEAGEIMRPAVKGVEAGEISL